MLPQYTYLTKNVYLSLTDEYFVSNIEKVDSVTLLRKDKVMNGVSWSMRFQQALSTWPCLNDLGASAVQVKIIFFHFAHSELKLKIQFGNYWEKTRPVMLFRKFAIYRSYYIGTYVASVSSHTRKAKKGVIIFSRAV